MSQIKNKSEKPLKLKIESVNSYGCGVANSDDGRVMFVSGTVGGDGGDGGVKRCGELVGCHAAKKEVALGAPR